MEKSKIARELFTAIDTKNSRDFAKFLTPDCKFQFGNAPRVVGKEAIEQAVAGFFGSIDSFSHILFKVWEEKDAIICHGEVTYTRLDQTKLTVPFANVLYVADNLIREYLIFIDNSQLY